MQSLQPAKVPDVTEDDEEDLYEILETEDAYDYWDDRGDITDWNNGDFYK